MQQRMIYGLIDPMTREMRYIGSSTVGMVRPRQHFLPSAYLKSQRRVYRWIRQSIVSGIQPEIVNIEFVPEHVSLTETETGWIRYFRAIGCQLTNSTGSVGGTGMTGKRHSAESRAKISRSKTGSKFSEEIKARFRVARKGRTPKPHVIEAARQAKLGKPCSAETKGKISGKLRGVSHTPERRANTSAVMKKWWEDRHRRVSQHV